MVVCCFPQILGFPKKKVDTQAVTVGLPSNGCRASSISALPAPAGQTITGGTACSLLPVVGSAAAHASPPHRTPIAGLAISLLTHTCCYSPATADEPVNPRTPPRGKQLSSILWLRVIPFLGLAVVHCPGALDTAWSTVNERHPSEVDCTWSG